MDFLIRRSPYLPSFRRIAAKIIDPANGASTWALGSHRCNENRGSFTKKAVVSIKYLMFLLMFIGTII